jgi:hypothetical protein
LSTYEVITLELLTFAEPLVACVSTILGENVIRSLNHGYQSYLPCQMPANYIERNDRVNIVLLDVTTFADVLCDKLREW